MIGTKNTSEFPSFQAGGGTKHAGNTVQRDNPGTRDDEQDTLLWD